MGVEGQNLDPGALTTTPWYLFDMKTNKPKKTQYGCDFEMETPCLKQE
jgi:hypothetical protein